MCCHECGYTNNNSKFVRPNYFKTVKTKNV